MRDLLLGDDGELITSQETLEETDQSYTEIVPLSELFLADPDNEIIVTGADVHQAQALKICILIVHFVVMLWFVVLKIHMTTISLMFFLWAGLLTFFMLDWERARHRALRENGELLGGQVVYYKKGMPSIGSFDEVYYRFVTPDGRELIMRARVARQKPILRFKPQSRSKYPPEEGTPVAVLYFDDDNFRLL